MSYLEPTLEQLRELSADLESGPIVMINLLRFKGEGGSEMFGRYLQAAGPLLEARGGRVVYRGACGPTAIGPESWDLALLVEYPNRRALIDLLRSPEYQSIAHLRQGALEDSRLILTNPSGA